MVNNNYTVVKKIGNISLLKDNEGHFFVQTNINEKFFPIKIKDQHVNDKTLKNLKLKSANIINGVNKIILQDDLTKDIHLASSNNDWNFDNFEILNFNDSLYFQNELDFDTDFSNDNVIGSRLSNDMIINEEQINEESINEESINEESINEESINEESINEESINEESINEESINEESINEESINEESINEESLNEESINKVPINKAPINKAPINTVSARREPAQFTDLPIEYSVPIILFLLILLFIGLKK